MADFLSSGIGPPGRNWRFRHSAGRYQPELEEPPPSQESLVTEGKCTAPRDLALCGTVPSLELLGSIQGRHVGDIDFSASVPDIMISLQSDPELGRAPEQFGESHGKLGRDRPALGQYVPKVLARDAKQPRDFRLRFSDGRKHVLAEQLPRMRRAYVRVTHRLFLLVILFEVYSESIAFAEFESDAPRAIHMDRVAFGTVTMKPMKIEAGKVEVFQRVRIVENVQPPFYSAVKSRVKLGFARIP